MFKPVSFKPLFDSLKEFKVNSVETMFDQQTKETLVKIELLCRPSNSTLPILNGMMTNELNHIDLVPIIVDLEKPAYEAITENDDKQIELF